MQYAAASTILRAAREILDRRGQARNDDEQRNAEGANTNEKHPVRSHRQGRRRHRLQPRHRPLLRRAARKARRQGRGLLAQGRRLPGGRRRHQAAGGDATVIPCNIARKDEVEALIAGATKHYGKIDILVCNAAVNPYYGPLLDITDEAFDKIMGRNVKSNIWLSALAIPQMAERGDGSVVIISSIGGLRGSTVIGAYGISKAADFALCRFARRRMGPERRPRQLHRARPRQDRFRPRAVGRRSQPQAPHRHHAASPHRRARRDRRRRGLPRLRRVELHDRPDHRHRRRRDDGGGVILLPLPLRERVLPRAEPGEGFLSACNPLTAGFAEHTRSSGASRHLLPQGEKEEAPRASLQS